MVAVVMLAVVAIDSLDYDDCVARCQAMVHNCCSGCACAADVDCPYYGLVVRAVSAMSAKSAAPSQCDYSRRVTLEEILQSRTTKSTYSHSDKDRFRFWKGVLCLTEEDWGFEYWNRILISCTNCYSYY